MCVRVDRWPGIRDQAAQDQGKVSVIDGHRASAESRPNGVESPWTRHHRVRPTSWQGCAVRACKRRLHVTNSMNLSGQERVEFFIQKYVDYSVLHQKCADRLRAIGRDNFAGIYEEACKEWLSDHSNPLFELPHHEKEKRDMYLAKCDEICQTEPKTVREYV